jgi:broad-specificity NMP kinase
MAAIADSPMFTQLSDVTSEKVQKLFMNGYNNEDLDAQPTLIVIIGCPGVGKSRIAKSYKNMYHVSLDTIVERIEPYCALTREAYETIKRKFDGKDVPYGPFADLYSTVISSTQPNFGLLDAESVLYKKIHNKMQTDAVSIKQTPKKTRSKKISHLKSVLSHFYDALEYAVKESFNIMYDTTFDSNTNKMDKIMKMVAGKNYRVIVLHVVASEEQIHSYLNGRHRKMLESGCLRAINPDLISKYIIQNAMGYNLSYSKYKTQAKFMTIVNDAANKSDYYIGPYRHKYYKDLHEKYEQNKQQAIRRKIHRNTSSRSRSESPKRKKQTTKKNKSK